MKVYGVRPIDPRSVAPAADLSADEQQFLAALWEKYRQFSASSLRQMTHEHKPWIDARKGLRPEQAGSVEITQAAMKAFFTKLLKA
jgi:uncharacterized phage-associated protein